MRGRLLMVAATTAMMGSFWASSALAQRRQPVPVVIQPPPPVVIEGQPAPVIIEGQPAPGVIVQPQPVPGGVIVQPQPVPGGVIVQPQPAPRGAAPRQGRGAINDALFAAAATSANLAELSTSNLAAQRAGSDEVRKFARQMIADHTRASQELNGLAAAKLIAVPNGLDFKDQAVVDGLNGLSGEEFDRAYVQYQILAHRGAIALFRNEAQRGLDPDLKAWAAKTLPRLQHHLEMARGLRVADEDDAEAPADQPGDAPAPDDAPAPPAPDDAPAPADQPDDAPAPADQPDDAAAPADQPDDAATPDAPPADDDTAAADSPDAADEAATPKDEDQ